MAPWNETCFHPPVKIYFTDRSEEVLLLWIIFVIYVTCLSCFRVCSLQPWGQLLGKDWQLGSHVWCFIVFLSLSRLTPWARRGTWLYQFLIFASLNTFTKCHYLIMKPNQNLLLSYSIVWCFCLLIVSISTICIMTMNRKFIWKALLSVSHLKTDIAELSSLLHSQVKAIFAHTCSMFCPVFLDK